jgi:RNA polymerase sigma-70 factor (ECF subfamily)
MGEQLLGLLPRLGRFARGLTGSTEDANDLVQAACQRALEREHQWMPGTRLDSWMFRIVRTLEIVVDGPRLIEARLTFDSVRRAVGKLPEAQREVLLLVCVEGLSYRETAETLGLPMGTVMSRLARARLAIARLTEENKDRDDETSNVVRWS